MVEDDRQSESAKFRGELDDILLLDIDDEVPSEGRYPFGNSPHPPKIRRSREMAREAEARSPDPARMQPLEIPVGKGFIDDRNTFPASVR